MRTKEYIVTGMKTGSHVMEPIYSFGPLDARPSTLDIEGSVKNHPRHSEFQKFACISACVIIEKLGHKGLP